MIKEEDIREMLRKDKHQKVLDYLVRVSGYQTGILNGVGVINSVSQEVFFGRKDRLARTNSSIELFHKYELIELNGNEIKITKKTLDYATK